MIFRGFVLEHKVGLHLAELDAFFVEDSDQTGVFGRKFNVQKIQIGS